MGLRMVVAGHRLLDVGACARLCWGLTCFVFVGWATCVAIYGWFIGLGCCG